MYVVLRTALVTCLLALVSFSATGSTQCELIDPDQGSVYLSFERTAMVKIDGKSKPAKGLIMQLHNNSSCSILVTTGSADGLYKPLPPNPTVMDTIRREILYPLSDGAMLPFVQYWFETRRERSKSVGGDMFFQFEIGKGKFVRFEVPYSHLDSSFASKLELDFDYLWETSNNKHPKRSNVRNTLVYWIASLPEEVRKEIR